MTPADASWRLLSLLWQASWQGALFAVVIGLICLLFRVPAPYRALLWFLAGVKFIGGFVWLLLFGSGVPLNVMVPAELLPVSQAATVVQANPFLVFTPWVVAAWISGVVLCILMVVIRARATYQTLSRATPHIATPITEMITALSERVGVSPNQIPSVRVAPKEMDGPQVTLVGDKCVVVLPETLLPPSPDALSESDLRFVIAHELAHIRRGDLWAGLLFAAMQTLFFFHPCAIWVKREWEAAREEACDLLALRVCTDGDRDTAARYGALLLRLGSGGTAQSAGSARIAASPFAALHRRLTHLNRYQTENHGRFSPASVLLGLPIIAALILPITPRWIVSSTQHADPKPVVKHGAPSQKPVSNIVKAIPVIPRIASHKTTLSVMPPSVNTDSLKQYSKLKTTERVSVAVLPSAPSRLSNTSPEKPVVSGPVKTTPAILSEPVLAVEETTVEPILSAITPNPGPVVPEASPDIIDEPSQSPVVETIVASGSSTSPRSGDSISTRAYGIASEIKGVARTSSALPVSENPHSFVRPVPIPSPSAPPTSTETTIRESDIPRPPQR